MNTKKLQPEVNNEETEDVALHEHQRQNYGLFDKTVDFFKPHRSLPIGKREFYSDCFDSATDLHITSLNSKF